MGILQNNRTDHKIPSPRFSDIYIVVVPVYFEWKTMNYSFGYDYYFSA